MLTARAVSLLGTLSRLWTTTDIQTVERVQKLCESENLELFETCMHNPLEMFESEQYTSETTENLKFKSFV